MRNYLSAFLQIPALLLLLTSAASAQQNQGPLHVRIAWDYSSMQQLADMGGYPRLIRLKDSTLLVIYETRRGSVDLKRSVDNGRSWSSPVEVFSPFVYTSLNGKSTVVNISNPEIKQLQNGDIVIACNYRPQKQEVAPYSIVVRRSVDRAHTWLQPQSLYSSAPRFGDGCWEPAFLQLPTGELQVYFANENPYQNSDEQEISMISSNDNGATWSSPVKTVSFRKGRRDGMPVPIITKDDIVVAVEDNKTGQFKPYTVRTPLSQNWKEPVLANSPDRTYALDQSVADTIYMGAPYLLKLPNGQTLLSYQTNEKRMHDWELSTMEVAIGNEEAKNFGRRSRPFEVPLNKEAKWNSLSLWDSRTVVALTSSNFRSPWVAPWLLKGYLISDLKLSDSPTLDHCLFIGSKGEDHLDAGLTLSKDSVFIECQVEASTETLRSGSPGVFLFWKSNHQLYKLWTSKRGKWVLQVKKQRKWVKSSVAPLAVEVEPAPQGYRIRYKIPTRFLGKESSSAFHLGLALSACREGKEYVEYLADMKEDDPQTWLKVLW